MATNGLNKHDKGHLICLCFFFFEYDWEGNQLNISDRVVLIASRCRIVTVHNRTTRKFLGAL